VVGLANRWTSTTTLVLAEDATDTSVSAARRIDAVRAVPARVDICGLVGAAAVSGFRRRLATVAPEELASGSLLHLLLDDIPGSTIVSEFALRQ
jgi:hypothetical protein